MTVEIYSKPNCSLCDQAKLILGRVRTQVEFVLVEIDVTADPELFLRYRYDIPVVFIDGQKAFKHRLDEATLLERLQRAR